jgi:hypothetical protein
VPIYREREVTGFEQDDTGVDVELSDGQSLRADYLVGCYATEKRLRIFELAVELLDDRGELDLEAAVTRQPDVNLAAAEAEGYARATRQAVEALRRMPAK